MEIMEIEAPTQKKINIKNRENNFSHFSNEQIYFINKIRERIPERIKNLKEKLKNIATEEVLNKRQYNSNDKNRYYEEMWNQILNIANSGKGIIKPIMDIRETEFNKKDDENKDRDREKHTIEMQYYKKLVDQREQFGRVMKRERDKRKRIHNSKEQILTNLLQEPVAGNAIIYKSKKTGKEYKAYIKGTEMGKKNKINYKIEIIDEIEKIVNEETGEKKKKSLRTNFLTSIEPNEIKNYIKVRDLRDGEQERVTPKDVEEIIKIINDFTDRQEKLLNIHEDIVG